MLFFGDLRLWAIVLGFFVAAIVASLIFKAVTGHDLEPPDDGPDRLLKLLMDF